MSTQQDERHARIYALIDPRDSLVRYVGVTGAPLAERLAEHAIEARGSDTRKARWLRDLSSYGLTPSIVVLAGPMPTSEAYAAEHAIIRTLKLSGVSLTNSRTAEPESIRGIDLSLGEGVRRRTAAAQKLGDHMLENRISLTAMARRIGVKHVALHRFLVGDRWRAISVGFAICVKRAIGDLLEYEDFLPKTALPGSPRAVRPMISEEFAQ